MTPMLFLILQDLKIKIIVPVRRCKLGVKVRICGSCTGKT
jgi:hypothetical protein